MRGVVLTSFSDLVIEHYGLQTWEDLLKKANPKSGGAYTAAEAYSDDELKSLILVLSEMKNLKVDDLLVTFGEYMFSILGEKFPMFFLEGMSLKDFLLSIDRVIHIEVKKLYPDASLPVFRYEDPAPEKLIIYYNSPRKLCHLGIGLMRGAAKHFKKSLEISHAECLHRGDPHCRFDIEFP